MEPFETRIGRRTLGNKAASGTEIIKELGEEHVRTGSPIVYTSADSVFQIAAHEEVIPLFELYKMCETAREILRGPYEVGRVIARPFVGEPGAFTRTSNRHDYAVPPPRECCSISCRRAESRSIASARFSMCSWGGASREQVKTKTNADGMAKTLDGDGRTRPRADLRQPGRLRHAVWASQRCRRLRARSRRSGCLAAVARRASWRGRSRDSDGGSRLRPDHASTDHSREYVPLLVYGPKARAGVNLGVRGSLSDIGQTVAENFGTNIVTGTSFLRGTDRLIGL